jgi:PAS domain S-box-containing protein
MRQCLNILCVKSYHLMIADFLGDGEGCAPLQGGSVAKNQEEKQPCHRITTARIATRNRFTDLQLCGLLISRRYHIMARDFLRQVRIFATRDGTSEREIARTMSNTTQTKRPIPASGETLLHMLETLPGALFIIDDTTTIIYVNASAQALTRATRENVCGKPLWRGAPSLVSTALYQAVQKTRQTRAPTEVEYVSPVTQTWLRVQLTPTVDGLLLHVHETREPVPHREMLCTDDHLAADILENMYVGVGFLTPEGILLEINEAPLADAQLRREEVIGYPFAETPWWTCYPESQEQLRTAITRASRGEMVRFETLVHPSPTVVDERERESHSRRSSFFSNGAVMLTIAVCLWTKNELHPVSWGAVHFFAERPS